MREAIESVEESRHRERDVYTAPVSVRELHEFLALEGKKPSLEQCELRAVNA